MDMRRISLVAIGILVAGGLLGAGALVVGQTKVPSQAIASAVTRTPELVERAWRLPVAATFNRQLTWQSNGSRCGPAAVANAYRSLGEAATTESKVLAGTGRCWTGFCIIGLTLDELADVARANTGRRITVALIDRAERVEVPIVVVPERSRLVAEARRAHRHPARARDPVRRRSGRQLALFSITATTQASRQWCSGLTTNRMRRRSRWRAASATCSTG
jgi:hypothetical protein